VEELLPVLCSLANQLQRRLPLRSVRAAVAKARMPKTCYYELLGIEPTATADDIKRGYRKAALQWHPDKNPTNIEEATERFRGIQNAHAVLSDPQERAWYDSHRNQILRDGGEPPLLPTAFCGSDSARWWARDGGTRA
jgi:hypothetical protein